MIFEVLPLVLGTYLDCADLNRMLEVPPACEANIQFQGR